MARSGIKAVLLAVAVGLAGGGCGKTNENTGGPPPGAPPGPPMAGITPAEVLAKLPGGEEHAAGKKVYVDSGCFRCHKLGDTGGMPTMGGMPMPGGPGGPAGLPMPGGPGGMPMPGGPGMGGPPGMSGPDLTKVGAEAEHTAKWLADHVRNPKAHKPQSMMPPSGADKISDADLDKLAAYLASRK